MKRDRHLRTRHARAGGKPAPAWLFIPSWVLKNWNILIFDPHVDNREPYGLPADAPAQAPFSTLPLTPDQEWEWGGVQRGLDSNGRHYTGG